uniref:Uncharacterized protein n=1 Tax=Physcomitrium patens TaxID=3218 RepID=A0A2K1LAB3_PHYPA|nr:hypothetical protein PHYPA_001384 [Physcomitrium patens]
MGNRTLGVYHFRTELLARIYHLYELLYTPHINKLGLWKTSEHYYFYKENIYYQMQIEEELYHNLPTN